MKEKAKSTQDEQINQTIPDVENPDNHPNDNDSGDDSGDNTRDAMSIDQLEAIARSGSVTAVSENAPSPSACSGSSGTARPSAAWLKASVATALSSSLFMAFSFLKM